jgi:hypothetical protein
MINRFPGTQSSFPRRHPGDTNGPPTGGPTPKNKTEKVSRLRLIQPDAPNSKPPAPFHYEDVLREAPILPVVPLDIKPGQTLTAVRDSVRAGLGDLVSMGAALLTFRHRFPEHAIHVLTAEPLNSILELHPGVDRLLHARDEIDPDSFIVDMGACPCGRFEQFFKVPEPSPRNVLFALALGLDYCEQPRVYLSAEETEFGKNWLREHDLKKPLGVVWKTSGPNKDYRYMPELFKELRKHYDAYLIENMEPTQMAPDTNGLTIREIAGVISQTHTVISADTGWLHVAGGLGVPLVGIFGSYPAQQTMRPYNVPFQAVVGPCPYGKQPCRAPTCLLAPPCLAMSVSSILPQIREFLDR